MKVDIYIASDNRQPRRGDRWTGYLICAEKRDKALISAKLMETTEYRAIITTLVEALDRFTRPAEITVHIENGWVIGRLSREGVGENNLDIWQRNGWKTARGTVVKYKDDWQRLYNKMRVFEHSGAVFHFAPLDKEDKKRERILRLIESKRDQEV